MIAAIYARKSTAQADRLGHHSIKLTVDTHGHLVSGANRRAVDRLNDVGAAPVRNLRATSLDAHATSGR